MLKLKECDTLYIYSNLKSSPSLTSYFPRAQVQVRIMPTCVVTYIDFTAAFDSIYHKFLDRTLGSYSWSIAEKPVNLSDNLQGCNRYHKSTWSRRQIRILGQFKNMQRCNPGRYNFTSALHSSDRSARTDSRQDRDRREV